MALRDRIQNPAAAWQSAIPVHVFTAAFSLWVRGRIDAARLQAAFGLDTGEIQQAQNLKAAYDGLPTTVAKAQFLLDMEHAGILYERGIISAAEYGNIMGL